MMETERKRKCPDLTDAEYDREKVGPQYKRGRLNSTDASTERSPLPYEEAKKANTRLEYLSRLDICSKEEEMPCVRNTGIICTIGKLYSTISAYELLRRT